MTQVALGIRGMRLDCKRGLWKPEMRRVRGLIRRLAKVSPVVQGKPLWVVAYPKMGLVSHDGKKIASGFFVAGKRKGQPLGEIHVACNLPGIMIELILCHEWAHYEQWRSGRKCQERGVSVRARTLGRLARKCA